MDYAAPISFNSWAPVFFRRLTRSDIFHNYRPFHIGSYIYLQETETAARVPISMYTRQFISDNCHIK